MAWLFSYFLPFFKYFTYFLTIAWYSSYFFPFHILAHGVEPQLQRIIALNFSYFSSVFLVKHLIFSYVPLIACFYSYFFIILIFLNYDWKFFSPHIFSYFLIFDMQIIVLLQNRMPYPRNFLCFSKISYHFFVPKFSKIFLIALKSPEIKFFS